jgi:hypothetical protein
MPSHHILLYLLIRRKKCLQRRGDSSIGGKGKRRNMSATHASTEDHDESGVYEIRIKGHLGNRWAAWFESLTITLEDNGETLLTGPVVDQAALHGVLRKVRDVGMPLISVARMKPGHAETSEVKETHQHRSKKE